MTRRAVGRRSNPGGSVERLAVVDGMDGLFIGLANPAASLGCFGDPMHPKVRAKIADTIKRIRDAGMPAGVLAPYPQFDTNCIEPGSIFSAVGVCSQIRAEATEALDWRFISPKLWN